MSKDNSRIKRLKLLAGAEPTRDALFALEQELYLSSNDRATVVLFASFVESALSKLIEHTFRPGLKSEDRKRLLGFEGVFGTFSSKIIFAYAFDLIGPKTRADLDEIRHLRNAMAHSRVPLNFCTPEVSEVCCNLRIGHEPNSHLPLFYLNKVPEAELQNAIDKSNAKTSFISTCHNLTLRMFVAKTYPKEGDIVYLDDKPLP